MGAYSVLKQHEKAHEDAIWSVCWASQNQLLTGSLDTTAILWKLHNQSGETRLTVDTVHEGFCLGVVSIDMAPKSSIAAVAAMDCKIRLLDLDKPVESREIMKIDASPVESWKVKFSPSGKHIATGGLSGKINMYSLENMESAPTKTQFDVGKFAYSVDFVSIVQLFHRPCTVRLTNLDTNQSHYTESRRETSGCGQCGRHHQYIRSRNTKTSHPNRCTRYANQSSFILTRLQNIH